MCCSHLSLAGEKVQHYQGFSKPDLPHGLSLLFQAEDVTGRAMPELPALGQLDAAASVPAREQGDPKCVSVCCFSAR